MVKMVKKQSNIVKNGPKWSKMIPNGYKWSQVVTFDPKCSKGSSKLTKAKNMLTTL